MKEETNQMGLMKKLTSAIVASSLVFGMVGSAFAAYTPAAGETAGNRMLGLQIIKGKYADDALALKDEITRAELVTVIVRAFGQEANAALLNGAAAYPDTASHWASGNIAMAKALVEKVGGDAIGMPDGTFAPDAKLTPAQAVAFLMKFLGVKADATKAWPASYLDVAVEKNIITAEDAALLAPMSNDNATRGLVFYLFDRAFSSYDLGAGKTFYTKYVDTTAPVVTVNAVAATTLDSKITITGKAEGATEVFVGTTAVTLDANGNFSADYELTELKEYNIAVTAKDLAGNTDVETLTVTRTVGNVAAIDAAAITVAAGATVDVAAAAKDAKGNTVAGVAITGQSAVGTYADGKFTAGEKAGEGELTLTAGEVTAKVKVTVVAGTLAKVATSAPSVAPGKSVTLIGQDAYGNTITGVTFSQDSANALLDATNGTFIATKAGVYTVKATKDGVTAEGKVGVYGDVAKLVVSAPATMVGNDETEYEVTVTAVDKEGNTVLTYERDIKLYGIDTTDKDATVTAEDGVAKFTVTASDAFANSEVEIVATFDEESTAGYQESDEFSTFATVEAQVATSIKVSAPEYLPTNDADTGVEVTVEVLDQVGEVMTDGAWEVDIAVTGPARLDNDEKTDSIGISAEDTFVVFPTETGDTGEVDVTVSFTGLTAGKDTLKARFAQDPKTIVLTSNKTEVAVDETTAQDEDDTVSQIEYTVKVVDKNGVPAVYNGNLDITISDVDDKYFVNVNRLGDFDDNANTAPTWSGYDSIKEDGVDHDNNADTAPVTVTRSFQVEVINGTGKFRVNSQKADAIKVKVSDNTDETATMGQKFSLTTSAELAATFTPASAKYVGLTQESLSYLLKDGAEVSLTAQLYDRFGNKVAKEGVEVVFTHEDFKGVKLNGAAEDAKVKTDANGVATVKATLRLDATDEDIELSDDSAVDVVTGEFELGNEAFAAATLTAQMAIPANIALEIVSSDAITATRPSSVKAGYDFYLKATVKDNYGDAMTGLDLVGSAFTFEIKDSNSDWSVGDVDFVESEKDGVYFAGPITPEVAETLTMTVNLKGTADTVTASRSIAIKAGDVASVKVVEANSDDELDITANKVGEYTVQLTDAFGNTVTSSQVTSSVTVMLLSTDDGGQFRNTNGKVQNWVSIGSGRTTAKFTYIGEVVTGEALGFFLVNWTDSNDDGLINEGDVVTPVAGSVPYTVELK